MNIRAAKQPRFKPHTHKQPPRNKENHEKVNLMRTFWLLSFFLSVVCIFFVGYLIATIAFANDFVFGLRTLFHFFQFIKIDRKKTQNNWIRFTLFFPPSRGNGEKWGAEKGLTITYHCQKGKVLFLYIHHRPVNFIDSFFPCCLFAFVLLTHRIVIPLLIS